VLVNWASASAVTRDSIGSTVSNTRMVMLGNQLNGTSAAIRVILNTNLDAVCANKSLGMFGNPGFRRAGSVKGSLRTTGKKGERRIRP
jgi:hypothetical protein